MPIKVDPLQVEATAQRLVAEVRAMKGAVRSVRTLREMPKVKSPEPRLPPRKPEDSETNDPSEPDHFVFR